jgi:putative transposase
VPSNLKRYYGHDDLHFITFSCYQRRPLLGTAPRRDLLLKILEQVRKHYGFVVLGYVVMPEHVHLLISEPERRDPSVVMQVLKQEFAKKVMRSIRAPSDPRQSQLWVDALEAKHVWEARFYDFNVWSGKKSIEKLRYMHRNPVQRGLVKDPQEWRWSSFRHYAFGERGPVLVNEQRPAVLKITAKRRSEAAIAHASQGPYPTRRKKRDEWGTHVFAYGLREVGRSTLNRGGSGIGNQSTWQT